MQNKAIDIKTFTEKYTNYFGKEFNPDAESYYRFFDSPSFPNECRSLGFEMDCGQSFTEAYGEEAWRSNQGLSLIIDKINNLKILGSALFSKWRFFNHWACSHATDDDKKWFLAILYRMQEIAYSGDY